VAVAGVQYLMAVRAGGLVLGGVVDVLAFPDLVGVLGDAVQPSQPS